MQEYFVYFNFFKRKDRDKRFGEGRRRSRQGFFYSRRDGPAPLEAATRIGIPIESGWYRVIYAPGCAFAPPGAFFGLERRDGRTYPPVPAAANVGADAERSCSRRRSVTDAACPLRVLIGPQVLVLLGSSTERRCAERRDLSGGRERRDGQLITKILRGQFRTTVRTSPLSFLGRPKPFFSFWQRKKRMVLEKYSKMNIQQKEFVT